MFQKLTLECRSPVRSTSCLRKPSYAVGFAVLIAVCGFPQHRSPATRTVELAVIVLPSTYGSGNSEHYCPRRISALVPADLTNRHAAFGAAGRLWLGLKGWAGSASEGADGSTSVLLHPATPQAPTGSARAPAGPTISYSDSGGCAGCAMHDCAVFFGTRPLDGSPISIPHGLKTRRLSSHLVEFSLPGRDGISVSGVAFCGARPITISPKPSLLFGRRNSHRRKLRS